MQDKLMKMISDARKRKPRDLPMLICEDRPVAGIIDEIHALDQAFLKRLPATFMVMGSDGAKMLYE